MLGDCYLKLGNLEQAKHWYLKALTIDIVTQEDKATQDGLQKDTQR